MKTIIIAEGGVNHNGKVSLAKKIITKAKEAGADYIKFQLYDADDYLHRKQIKLIIKKNLIKMRHKKKC